MPLLSLSALEAIVILEVLPLVLVPFLLLRFWGLLLPEITTRRTKIFLKNQSIAQASLCSYFRFPQEQSAALDVHRKLTVGGSPVYHWPFKTQRIHRLFIFIFL